MFYYTGDTHGQTLKLQRGVDLYGMTEDDVVVVMGDAGFNYYGPKSSSDRRNKRILSTLAPTFFCIHGNHEMRPHHIPSYEIKEWHGGKVYVEEKYPKLLFAIDGEIYDFNGVKTIVIGGAYSVDKYYRLQRGVSWFEDEQPNDEIKAKVEAALEGCGWKIDQVLSHTCPAKYTPTEAFLPGLDQSTVDRSTEEWLDSIEDRLTYSCWICGHWHIDKTVDKLMFLMNDFVFREGR